jgi:tRNA(adenine34) deaminase
MRVGRSKSGIFSKGKSGTFMTGSDTQFMLLAIAEAEAARDLDEVPVGAVIVSENGDILAAASNRTITNNDPTAHAEILALRAAAKKVGNYRLTGATVYSTIEPCVMCAGALVNARVSRLVFGAPDERFGAVETKFRICDNPDLNHRMEIVGGVMATECRELIQTFFQKRRAA